jgi:benzoate transport
MQVQQILRDGPMTRYQMIVVAMCVTINVLDGFDILALAFVSPALARTWSLSSERLGFLLSSGLLGIGIGALFFSFLADAVGRRPVILVSLAIMSLGMAASGFAATPDILALSRVLTGLGIGGMTASGGALAMEYSSDRRKTLAVSLVVIGYPFGATAGGAVALWLLEEFGWRAVFWFGSGASALLFPVLLVWLPESPSILLKKRTAKALRRLNRYMLRMGLEALADVPAGDQPRQQVGACALLRDYRSITAKLALAYAAFMFAFYFIINWATKLVTEMGLPDRSGVTASIIINLCGIAGGLCVGLASGRMKLSWLVAAVLCVMWATIAFFGSLPPTTGALYLASAALGFFMWAGSALAYSVIALAYPAEIRASGIGLIVTIGRIGSILGPYTAGLLLGSGVSRAMTTFGLASPVLIAAILFAAVAHRKGSSARA